MQRKRWGVDKRKRHLLSPPPAARSQPKHEIPSAHSPPPIAHCLLNVKVVPGASRDRIAGRYGDGIKVQVSAPPEKGKANIAVISVIAVALGVREADIVLLRGHTQPRKVLQINGLDQDKLNARLERFLSH